VSLSHFSEKLGEIHILSLEGLGASYRLKGFFELKVNNTTKKINFKGVAFGGHYGGHNVNIEISPRAASSILSIEEFKENKVKLDELLSEVQRRILNGEMIVEFERLKQETNVDPFGNISP
jgi:hypothetical protein